jgi:hypothetical protein
MILDIRGNVRFKIGFKTRFFSHLKQPKKEPNNFRAVQPQNLKKKEGLIIKINK